MKTPTLLDALARSAQAYRRFPTAPIGATERGRPPSHLGAGELRSAIFRRNLASLLCSCVLGCSASSSPPVTSAESASTTPPTLAATAPLPAPATLLDEADINAFEAQGETDKVSVTLVEIDDQPFTKALQARIIHGSNSEWSVQAQAQTPRPVKQGDTLLASFYARVTSEQEVGGGETRFVFELAKDPWTKSVTYAVPLTSDWRQVQIPFRAVDDYDAGDAQLIFRLGYEPETFQIGGLRVLNYGSGVPLSRLPTTKAVDQRLATATHVAAPLPPVNAGKLSFEVHTDQVIGTISPYVYGINSQNFGHSRATVRRNGGNRGTAYNWELNASNAGKDWKHVNDDWPCSVMGFKDCNAPGTQMLAFAEANQRAGAQSVVTIPMLDYVSADKRGSVKLKEAAPSPRFAKSLPQKPDKLTIKPNLEDGVVYQDELVNLLVNKFGRADQGGVLFYSLDNEPALWNETHPRIHPEHATYEEVLKRTEATALAIDKVDPSAKVLGGVMFGWNAYQTLNGAPDAEKYNAEYGNYLEYLLASLKQLEQTHGKRLVHLLDVHWYPEARGHKRITGLDADPKTIDARLQAPRSLWDSTYVEKSWITKDGKPIRLIPWLREAVSRRYPGTHLSMTEYNFGAPNHISGALAQVDALGVFGREGLYLANYWGKGAGVKPLPKYIESAFKMYRNYDGNGGAFASQAVKASAADAAAASIFAAVDPNKRLTVMVINKHQQHIYEGVLHLGTGLSKANVYTLSAQSTDIQIGPELAITQSGELRHKLEPLSATLFVCE